MSKKRLLIAAIVGFVAPWASASATPIISHAGDTCTAYVGPCAAGCGSRSRRIGHGSPTFPMIAARFGSHTTKQVLLQTTWWLHETALR